MAFLDGIGLDEMQLVFGTADTLFLYTESVSDFEENNRSGTNGVGGHSRLSCARRRCKLTSPDHDVLPNGSYLLFDYNTMSTKACPFSTPRTFQLHREILGAY